MVLGSFIQVRTIAKSSGQPRAMALLAEKGLPLMTMLSEIAPLLQGLGAAASSNQLSTEEGGEVGNPNDKKKKTENERSSYVTLQGCTQGLHTESRDKCMSFGVYFVTLRAPLLALPREYDGGINIPAAQCNLRGPRRTGSAMLSCAPFKAQRTRL